MKITSLRSITRGFEQVSALPASRLCKWLKNTCLYWMRSPVSADTKVSAIPSSNCAAFVPLAYSHVGQAFSTQEFGRKRMGNYVGRFRSLRFIKDLIVALGVLVIAVLPLCGSTPSFNIPDDVALRIRLDDTLTSVDS